MSNTPSPQPDPMVKDDILKPVQPCTTTSEQHGWLPTTGKGMQCFSCPMCKQRIYWSEINKIWVKVTPKAGFPEVGGDHARDI